MSNRSPRILRLYVEQKGRCYWCNRPALLPEQKGYWRKPGTPSSLAATFDHVYSRKHPLRNKKAPKPLHVMACHTCNGKRSKVECVVISIHGKLEPRVYRPDEPIPSKRERRQMAKAEARV